MNLVKTKFMKIYMNLRIVLMHFKPKILYN